MMTYRSDHDSMMVIKGKDDEWTIQRLRFDFPPLERHFTNSKDALNYFYSEIQRYSNDAHINMFKWDGIN